MFNVLSFFIDNNVITSFQSGFLPKDSTVNQLVSVYHSFCQALDDGKEVRAVFCDISKAFDRVWHEGLIFKLRRVGNQDISYLGSKITSLIANSVSLFQEQNPIRSQ